MLIEDIMILTLAGFLLARLYYLFCLRWWRRKLRDKKRAFNSHGATKD